MTKKIGRNWSERGDFEDYIINNIMDTKFDLTELLIRNILYSRTRSKRLHLNKRLI